MECIFRFTIDVGGTEVFLKTMGFAEENGVDIVLQYTVESMENRVRQVFGENLPDALIPVEEKTELISVHGFVGKPSLLKKTKGEQYLFLNSRYISNKNRPQVA